MRYSLRQVLFLLIISVPNKSNIVLSFDIEKFEVSRENNNNVVVGGTTRNGTSTVVSECDNAIYGSLNAARKLIPPPVESIENGDTESVEWWMEHSILLNNAWTQWKKEQETEYHHQQQHCIFSSLTVKSIINSDLQRDVYQTLKDPTLENEEQIHRAWEEVELSTTLPTEILSKNNENGREGNHKVFRYENFISPKGVIALRNHLDAIADSGVPRRRPNAMNRHGLLLDPAVPGGVAGNLEIHNFLDNLVRDFVRPLGRSFFPIFCGSPEDDIKYYAFTTRYGGPSSTGDLVLNEHSDASVITININLNLPNETYTGSSIYFVDENEKGKKQREQLQFESGTALLHRGMTRHGSIPLKSGQRNNLIIWLHGKEGYVRISPYEEHERLTVLERWSFGSTKEDNSSRERFGRLELKDLEP
mmetsp:Transcript_21172/g.23743  ORF Transcript_21172/g.23743 Transcript_21172/m.23743 type:complete len:419 (+) Transcript_21172:75-1331(+)